MNASKRHISILLIEIILTVVLFTFSKGQASEEFPIATTPGREMAVSAAFDGTNYLVGIQGDQNDHANITAQLVSQSGTLVGSRIANGRSGGVPFVAFDGTNYLMIWSDTAGNHPNEDIYGQFISKSGTQVGPPFPINQAPGYQEPTGLNGVIFDGVNYFVIWESRSNPDSGDTADIYGQFVTPSGTLLGSAIPVSTAVHGQRMPALAFDGTNILVVWADGRNQSACYPVSQETHCYESDIYGQFITKSSSSSAGTLFGTNFPISTSTLPRDNFPGIAFDGANYLVTFAEQRTPPSACPPSGCKWDIYGQLVTKAGTPVGSRITLSDTSPDHFGSVPVFNGINYLVTWTEGFGSTSATVKGRFFDKSGDPVGSEFTLFSPSGGRVPWFASTLFNGSEYFSIINRGTPGTDPTDLDNYTNQDVYGAFISPPGACTYSISPANQPFGSTGGIGSVNVTTASGCSWTTTSKASWIKITSGSSGAGNGVVYYSVSANTKTSSRTGTLTIAGQGCTVTQAGSPKMSVKPMSVNFGNIKAGSTSEETITVENTGSSDLMISNINIAGSNASEFSQTSNCTTIPAGSSCTVSVTFSPTLPFGKKSAVVSILSNDPKKPAANVKVLGNAPPPKNSVSPMSINFGDVKVGSTSAKTITVKNTGISDLVISNINITGTDASEFSLTNTCTTISKDDSCTVTMTFAPTSGGKKSAVMSVLSNYPKKPTVNVKLSGNGKY